ncbi:MAG TPA: hypothetical protein VFQ79_12855 [Bryobacteraceae bacterium]|nr:hypothetical protein [Bryobacteraceae bacterium]
MEIATSHGNPVTIAEADLDDLRIAMRGSLLRPGSLGYDEARVVFNGMFDRHPALIARCRGVTDVVDAVRFARE